MEFEDMNPEQDTKIDQSRLDEEWTNQANTYYHYSDAWERAKAEVRQFQLDLEETEEDVKRVRSRIALEANRNGIPGIDKVTDAKVEAYYRDHPDHIEAKDRWLTAQQNLADAETKAGKIGAVCYALQHKRTALEELVRLWLSQYWSDPKAPQPRDLRDEYRKAEAREDEDLTRRMQEGRTDRKKSSRTVG